MGGSGSGGGGGLGGLLGGVTKLFGKKPAASEQQEAPQPTNPLEIMSWVPYFLHQTSSS